MYTFRLYTSFSLLNALIFSFKTISCVWNTCKCARVVFVCVTVYVCVTGREKAKYMTP